MANQIAVGIDISKKTMDVAIGHEQPTAIFSNDGAGHQALIEELKNHPVSLIVMEATERTNWPVPARSRLRDSLSSSSTLGKARDFAKAMGRLVKTDSVDARMLAELAQVLNLRPDRDRFIKPMPDQAQQYLHALVLRRRQLVRLLVSERQRKHMAHAEVAQDIAQLMDVLSRQRALDRRIAEHLAQHQPNLAALLRRQGVGPATAATLMSELPRLGQLKARQICALVGVAPMNRDSGQARGKRFICGGRATVRERLVHGRHRRHAPQRRDTALLQRLLAAGKPKRLPSWPACASC